MRNLFGTTLLLVSCLATAGCDPIVEIFGSYFPAWIVCLFCGVFLVILSREALARLRIEPHLGPLFIVYPGLGLIFTLAIWLLFFRS